MIRVGVALIVMTMVAVSMKLTSELDVRWLWVLAPLWVPLLTVTVVVLFITLTSEAVK